VAKVSIPALLRPLTGGLAEVEAEGTTVRKVLENLESRFPGLLENFLESGRLRPGLSVAIDGEISPLGLIESVRPDGEIHFIPAVRGGNARSIR
jgi:sulfur-carrier protein